MTLFSLSPNANSNFPDRFRRRFRTLLPQEHSAQSVRGSAEARSPEDRQEFRAAGTNGSRVYASKFKADLTSLMSVTPWNDESDPARAPPSGARENQDPLSEFARADVFLGHLAALLASARSGDTALARTAAAALQSEALDVGDAPPSIDPAGAPPAPSAGGIDALQSLIGAATAGDIDAASAAARNWASDLRNTLAADARARRNRESIVDIVDPGAEAAYETLMEFTQGGVATAA